MATVQRLVRNKPPLCQELRGMSSTFTKLVRINYLTKNQLIYIYLNLDIDIKQIIFRLFKIIKLIRDQLKAH